MFSIFAAVLFLMIAILNLLLLFGLPLGELTMGGQYKVLPKHMKIPAALSLVVQVFAILVVLQAGGHISLWFSFGVTRVICYVYAGYLVLNACMCFISKSKKEKYIMTPLALCAAVCFFVTAFTMGDNRLQYVSAYVLEHQEELEQHMSAYFEEGENLSYKNDVDVKTVNAWEGEHPMVEYLMPVARADYYGFYYSPDDVPLAFQNAEYSCEETEDGWTWQGAGDNQGFTSRITDCWYYFEASF